MGAANRQRAIVSYAIDQTVRRYELLLAELTSARPPASAAIRHGQRPIG
jgi:hypothetical protein